MRRPDGPNASYRGAHGSALITKPPRRALTALTEVEIVGIIALRQELSLKGCRSHKAPKTTLTGQELRAERSGGSQRWAELGAESKARCGGQEVVGHGVLGREVWAAQGTAGREREVKRCSDSKNDYSPH
jgi:hypothetical protein